MPRQPLPHKKEGQQTPTGAHYRAAVREEGPSVELAERRAPRGALKREEGSHNLTGSGRTTAAERATLAASDPYRRRRAEAPLPDTGAPHRAHRRHAGAFGSGAPAGGGGIAPEPEGTKP